MLGPYASYNKKTGTAVWNPENPNAEYVGIFERINVQPKGIIHVGMWDFVEWFCYKKLCGTNVIGVEANKFIYETMSKPVADEHGFTSFNAYISDKDDEERDFYFAGEGSSLYQGPPEWNKTESIKIKTKTLSTLLKENDIDLTQFDFLNIDAEGSELDILKGFEKDLHYINVVDLETSVDDRHNSGCSHEMVVEWLTQRGFELTEMADNYQREGWGDSLFVRTDRSNINPFVQ